MGKIELKSEKREVKKKGETRVVNVYTKAELEKFSPAVLGLGDIGEKSRRIDVIVAVFDLSGFTGFCNQIDPHLSMPIFLKEFLHWLFEEIKSQIAAEKIEGGTVLYAVLPFFAKFTGDGVLFLWNTGNMNMTMICNIVVELRNVCTSYSSKFKPKMRRHLSYMPDRLRCGVACGTVCSVGNGEDYVGPCINIASRLQKLSNLGFCVSKRGIDFEKGMVTETAEKYIVKSVSIRDIGEDELVIVRKPDFEGLSEEDRALFKNV
jgi:class 3 adenylate cyclase